MSKLLSAITASNEGGNNNITEDSSNAQILRELSIIKQLLSKVALKEDMDGRFEKLEALMASQNTDEQWKISFYIYYI